MGIDAGFVRCWYHYVNSWCNFLLLGDRCAQVPRIGAFARRECGISQILNLILISLKRESRSVRSEHAHSNAALELFRVRNGGSTNVLRSDSQAHHKVGFGFNMNLPSRIFTIEGSMVGAAASCIRIPHSSNLLCVHALTFRSDRSHIQRLIAFYT